MTTTYRVKFRDRLAYRVARLGLAIASPEYRAMAEVVTDRGLRSLTETLAKRHHREDVVQANLRVLRHEAATPFDGHDFDGACCRRAERGTTGDEETAL